MQQNGIYAIFCLNLTNGGEVYAVMVIVFIPLFFSLFCRRPNHACRCRRRLNVKKQTLDGKCMRIIPLYIE